MRGKSPQHCAGGEGGQAAREAGLVGEPVFDHEAEEVNGVAPVAARAPALIGAAVEEALAAQHHVGALAPLPDLQPVLHLCDCTPAAHLPTLAQAAHEGRKLWVRGHIFTFSASSCHTGQDIQDKSSKIMRVMGARHGEGAMNIAAAAVLGLVLPPGGHQEVLSIHVAPVKAAGHVLGCHQWSRLIIVMVVLHWNHRLRAPSVAARLTDTGQRSRESCCQNQLAPAHLYDASCREVELCMVGVWKE